MTDIETLKTQLRAHKKASEINNDTICSLRTQLREQQAEIERLETKLRKVAAPNDLEPGVRLFGEV